MAAFNLKTTPEYVTLDPANKGGPKNGHYSELDPTFAQLKPAADAAVAGLWAADNWTDFRKLWAQVPPLPEDCPQPGKDVTVEHMEVPVRDGTKIGIKIMYSAKVPRDKSVLVLRVHGGGWAIGGHETENVENHNAAAIPGVVLVSVGYRLSPEHQFPVPLHDCFDVLKWCKANADALKIDPERIVTLGGSAGSNVAAVLALMARDEGVTGIVAQMLDWPTSCHPKFAPKDKYELESFVQNSDASVVSAVKMEFFLDAYTPDAKPDWRHSPLLAESLKGLPPAFVQIAGYDPLRDEGIAYAERMKAEGVPVEMHIYKGLPHCFSMLFPMLPQAAQFQQRQNDFLTRVVEGKL